MSSINEKFLIRPATVADSQFVSIGIREAERCHVGIGIYDVVIGQTLLQISEREKPDDTSRYLEHAYLNDRLSHVYMDNFLVAVDRENNQIAACCCSFPYPEFKLTTSKIGFAHGLVEILGYSKEKAEKAFDAWDFLDSAFPDVEYDHTWMIEAVYVSPAYRGQGLAQHIIQANMDSQTRRKRLATDPTEPDRRFLITCAVGNEGAKRVYEKLGFKLAGQGHSEECQQAIGCTGFYVLST